MEWFLFDELSDKYLKEAEIWNTNGILFLFRAEWGRAANTDNSFCMARVIGADTNFKYMDSYVAYIKHIFGEEASKALIAEGAKYGRIENTMLRMLLEQ